MPTLSPYGPCGLSLATATALWLLGAISTPHPLALAALLAASLGAALVGIIITARSPTGRRAPLLLLPAALLIAHLLAAVFADSVAVERFGTPRAPPPTDRLRVVSLNALHGYPKFADHQRRYRSTLAALREHDIDVLLLQEAWRVRDHGGLAERLANDLGMTGAWVRANGSMRFLGFEEGTAVLSRYPLNEVAAARLTPRRPFWERRVLVAAKIGLPRAGLAVASLHLARGDRPTTRAQAQDAALTADRLGTQLLGGDLNARIGGPTLDALGAAGFTPSVSAEIDHLLSRFGASEWVVEQAEVFPMRPAISDHPLLRIDLRHVNAEPSETL